MSGDVYGCSFEGSVTPFFSGGLAGAAVSVAAGVFFILKRQCPIVARDQMFAIALLTGMETIREKDQGYSSLLQAVWLQRQTAKVRTSQKLAVQ